MSDFTHVERAVDGARVDVGRAVDGARTRHEPDGENPFAALEKLFHEPARMAIVSELCGALDGLSFVALKEDCELTDGNLSRHLDKLQKEGVVTIDKSFVGARPRTTVHLTDAGRAKFIAYLQALEAVLRRAADALHGVEPDRGLVGGRHPASSGHGRSRRSATKTIPDLGA